MYSGYFDAISSLTDFLVCYVADPSDVDETMNSDFDMTAAFDAAVRDEEDVFLGSDEEHPDAWMEELQAQWAANKASKAAKKQRRAASVHAPGLTSSQAGGVKGLTKKQRKRLAKQQRRTAMYADVLEAAHADILPPSSSDDGVLPDSQKMYPQLLKINDDMASFHATIGKSKSKGKKAERTPTSGRISLGDSASAAAEQASRAAAAQAGAAAQVSFPPMHKAVRALLHQLARAYGLSSKSHNKGEQRFSVVSLSSHSLTSYPKPPRVDARAVARVLDNAARADRQGAAGLKGILQTNGAGRGGLKGAASAPRNRDGQQVGFGADKIGTENAGYRLLAMMGWQHGAGLGRQQGIAEPIAATVKVSKGGLGF